MSPGIPTRLGFLFALVLALGNPARAADKDFTAAIETMERDAGGIIGVYALDTGTGKVLAHRSGERFAFTSTFKPLLVAFVLSRVDSDDLSLAQELEVDKEDAVSYSPFIDTLEDGQPATVAALSEAAVTLGDNKATNMLLELTGGPPVLTAFLRTIGDDVTRVDRYETELNLNERGDIRDTTTPEAMVTSLLRVLTTDLLSDESRLQLQDWMVASKTGATRLRAGLPADWRVGDKTGTGRNGAVNDVAIAWPPGRPPIAIAVYMSWSEIGTPALSELHQEIAALIAGEFR